MDKKYFFIILVFMLVSCGQPKGITKNIDKQFICRDHYVEFDGSKEDRNLYYVCDDYKNWEDMFNTYWEKDNVKLENLDDSTTVASCSLFDKNDKNYGTEIQINKGFLYGYFGARMKVFKRTGTVQSFFTYNGGGNYEHDEIDIEFLGKDTTKVQFNYYDDDKGGHEYLYNLGFDASEGFHDYGFLWEEETITWFVDFEPVYQVKAKLNQWGRPMMNVWSGNPKNASTVRWLGKYEKSDEIYTTFYDYVIASELPLDKE